MKWIYELKNGTNLRKAITEEDYKRTLEELKLCWGEIHNNLPQYYDEDDLYSDMEDIDNQLDNLENFMDYGMTMDDVADEIDYLLTQFYDYCDGFRIWVKF